MDPKFLFNKLAELSSILISERLYQLTEDTFLPVTNILCICFLPLRRQSVLNSILITCVAKAVTVSMCLFSRSGFPKIHSWLTISHLNESDGFSHCDHLSLFGWNHCSSMHIVSVSTTATSMTGHRNINWAILLVIASGFSPGLLCASFLESWVSRWVILPPLPSEPPYSQFHTPPRPVSHPPAHQLRVNSTVNDNLVSCWHCPMRLLTKELAKNLLLRHDACLTSCSVSYNSTSSHLKLMTHWWLLSLPLDI